MNVDQEIKQIDYCLLETESNPVHPFNNSSHSQHKKCVQVFEQLRERKSELVMQRVESMFN